MSEFTKQETEHPKAPAHHRARKRFGQNFLVDQSIISRIVEAIDPQLGQHIVEIGPGQAALTRKLLGAMGANGSIDAIEIDRDLVAKLANEFDASKLRLHEADAMEFDFSTLPAPLRVIGNLPYNISTPILFRLCQYEDRIADMTFMLQKEVVDRMAAREDESARGRLSVMLQYRYRVEHCFDVRPASFRPMPSVDSAIVRLTPLGEERLRPRNELLFAQVVMAAFTQRRKMVRKSLAAFVPSHAWEESGIDPRARPEELSCEAFVTLADLSAV